MKVISFKDQRGSVSLEHIMFLGACILIAAGATAFYNNASTYMQGVGFSAAPTDVGSQAVGGAGAGAGGGD